MKRPACQVISKFLFCPMTVLPLVSATDGKDADLRQEMVLVASWFSLSGWNCGVQGQIRPTLKGQGLCLPA